MITYHDNKSYFSVSNDNGNTITRNLVATFVPFAPQTAFVRADFNRLFRLTDGTLLFPHFTNTTTKVEEISISTDGGKTWAKKILELFSSMPAKATDYLPHRETGRENMVSVPRAEGFISRITKEIPGPSRT